MRMSRCTRLGMLIVTVGVGSVALVPRSASAAAACASGTRNIGIHTGYSGGVAKSIRLCAVVGFKSTSEESTVGNKTYYLPGANGDVIVNSEISSAAIALFRDARAHGRTLSAKSSFRTMQHQQAICKKNANCRRGVYDTVAKPGFSNHQMGLAIDFVGPDVQTTGAVSCAAGRAKDPGNATWVYLENNARRFGFKQYVRESWHWDTMGGSARC
jgi:D-alanyl-D-alanine carboxypeptidase